MSPAIHCDSAAPVLLEHGAHVADGPFAPAADADVPATQEPAAPAAKKRYRAFPTLLRPVAVLADRMDRQIEITAMLIGAHGGLLAVVSHERQPQRVSILLPERQLCSVDGVAAGRLSQSHGREGTTLVFELGSRESVQLRFQEQAAPRGDAGSGARVLLQALGVALEPDACGVAAR
jgi:hypothetical protein